MDSQGSKYLATYLFYLVSGVVTLLEMNVQANSHILHFTVPLMEFSGLENLAKAMSAFVIDHNESLLNTNNPGYTFLMSLGCDSYCTIGSLH